MEILWLLKWMDLDRFGEIDEMRNRVGELSWETGDVAYLDYLQDGRQKIHLISEPSGRCEMAIADGRWEMEDVPEIVSSLWKMKIHRVPV